MEKRKRKNRLLKSITWTAGVIELLAVCCLDSDSNIPIYVCFVCLCWLVLMYAANRDR